MDEEASVNFRTLASKSQRESVVTKVSRKNSEIFPNKALPVIPRTLAA
jgi:hypothetical protein